jgi:hypothetical protein
VFSGANLLPDRRPLRRLTESKIKRDKGNLHPIFFFFFNQKIKGNPQRRDRKYRFNIEHLQMEYSSSETIPSTD